MNGQRGLFFLPFVCTLMIGLSALLLLMPSLDREEFLEARRIQHEQARAAAEAALALAVHREADVEEVVLGRAKASARVRAQGDELVFEAEARVPSFRDTEVKFTLEARYRRVGAGGLEPSVRSD